MIKDFDNWNNLKKKLDGRKNPPHFKEGEIWWCSVGVNIGYEIHGKNSLSNRPVLILKKFSRDIFLGIPLSSKIKSGKFYHFLEVNQKTSCAILSQIRVFDGKRLNGKIKELPEEELENLKEKVRRLI